MRSRLLGLCIIVLFLSIAASAQQTTTLDQETGNNTAACSAAGTPSYCSAGFTPMSDSASGVYNPAPGNVSTEDVHELLYSGTNTQLFTHYQPWFCMGSGSSTGTGSSCGSHIQVGYNSADAGTVHGQINDMIQRGFNGTMVDFDGTRTNASELTNTDMVNNDVANRCTGSQNCPFYFAVLYDQGSFIYTGCPQNGGGTDQTQCIITEMSADFDYMNAHYFGSLGYLRVDTSTMQISASGSPAVLFFICEACFTNPTPNWTNIWSALQQHTATYGTNAPNLFLYENNGGFTHAQTNGGFAWMNWNGSSDTYGLTYLDNFYNAAHSSTTSNPSLITFGAQWKGFDNTHAPWGPTPKSSSQQCGQTWLQTFQQPAHNGDFGGGAQLPFSGVVTWNDYEEGTEIETGIDNCLSLTAAMANDGNTLNWTLNFSSGSGSEKTVHHYLVFDSPDGTTLTQIASVPVGTHSLDLTQYSLSTGSHMLFVKAGGMPSILNQMSNGVAYSLSAAPTVQSVGLNPASTVGGTSSTGTVTLTQPAGSAGVAVTLASDNGAASVQAQVTVPSGASTANFLVSTQSVMSTTTANISASIGSSSASTALTITAAPATVSQVTVNPSSVTGGAGSTGTVTLSQAAGTGGVVVTLSSNSSAANVPSQVTVTSGSTSATFAVSTSTVTSTTIAAISGSIGSRSASGNLTITPAPSPTISSVTLSPTSVTGRGSSMGTVTLSQAAGSGGVVVTLSSNSSAASVPSQVTVASGSTSGTFAVSTSAVSSTTSAQISATLGSSHGSATLTISPAAATLSQVSFSSSSIGGSNQVTLTVRLSATASSAASVHLSSNSSALPVPSSVTVAKGSSSASTTITTRTVTSTMKATVTATYSGGTQSASVTINVTPTSLSLSSSSVSGGATVTGTITLTGAAPSGGQTVQLQSNSSYATVPSSVTVGAGAKSAQFKITTKKPSSKKSASITASAWNVSKSASLTIKP
jgi:hypothetical protein